MAVTVRPVYCSVLDVQSRMQASTTVQTSTPVVTPERGALISSIIAACSRRFDRLTGRPFGAYAPVFDVRYYSGRGSMTLPLDELATASKVEYNSTPARTPTWVNITADFGTSQMQLLPMRNWPKAKLWRIGTFVTDAYKIGNIRVTGVFGYVMPDGTVPAPIAPWQGNATQAAVNALSPDGSANSWWVTPEDVSKAIAEWSVYAFNAGRAGYGQQAGAGTAAISLPKVIPDDVQAVIAEYSGTSPRVATVSLDGGIIADAAIYGSTDDVSRWADWLNYPAFGQTGGGQ